MDKMQKMKKEVELWNVKAARKALEFRLLELEESSERVKDNIKIQLDKEKELEDLLKA